MKRLSLDLLRSIGLYVLLVVGGSLCFLSLAPVFGYLPYSDRPGPGWIGGFPAIGWADFWHGVDFMFGWALLLLPYAIVAGLLVFALARLLERAQTPRVVVAIVAALLAGVTAGGGEVGVAGGGSSASASSRIFFKEGVARGLADHRAAVCDGVASAPGGESR